jgi:hypothetical protein
MGRLWDILFEKTKPEPETEREKKQRVEKENWENFIEKCNNLPLGQQTYFRQLLSYSGNVINCGNMEYGYRFRLEERVKLRWDIKEIIEIVEKNELSEDIVSKIIQRTTKEIKVNDVKVEFYEVFKDYIDNSKSPKKIKADKLPYSLFIGLNKNQKDFLENIMTEIEEVFYYIQYSCGGSDWNDSDSNYNQNEKTGKRIEKLKEIIKDSPINKEILAKTIGYYVNHPDGNTSMKRRLYSEFKSILDKDYFSDNRAVK